MEYGEKEGLIVENKGAGDLIFKGEGCIGFIESNSRRKIFYGVELLENKNTNDPLQIINEVNPEWEK